MASQFRFNIRMLLIATVAVSTLSFFYVTHGAFGVLMAAGTIWFWCLFARERHQHLKALWLVSGILGLSLLGTMWLQLAVRR